MDKVRLAEFEAKTALLQKILSQKKAGSFVLTRQENFSWLTGGRGFVGMAAVTACAVLVVTPRQVFLVTENIEAQRLW
ncbi:MAG: aminopeptidase P family N-terminal domain-containing protein, partial [Lawsonibacter sp.]